MEAPKRILINTIAGKHFNDTEYTRSDLVRELVYEARAVSELLKGINLEDEEALAVRAFRKALAAYEGEGAK